MESDREADQPLLVHESLERHLAHQVLLRDPRRDPLPHRPIARHRGAERKAAPLQRPERAHEGLGVVDRLELARPEDPDRPTLSPVMRSRERRDVHAPGAGPHPAGRGAEGHRGRGQDPGVHVHQRGAPEHPARARAMEGRAMGVDQEIRAPAREHPGSRARERREEAVVREEVRDRDVGPERARLLAHGRKCAQVAERRHGVRAPDHALRDLRRGASVRGEETELVPAVAQRARPPARVDRGSVREEEDAQRGASPGDSGGPSFSARR